MTDQISGYLQSLQQLLIISQKVFRQCHTNKKNNPKYTNHKQRHRIKSMSVLSNRIHYSRATVSVIDTHHHLDLRATNRAAGAHSDDSVDASGTETRVAARDKCDALSLPDQTHLTAVAAGVVADVEVVVPVAAAGNAAQASELSPLCFDLRHSSNRSRLLRLFSLRRLSLPSSLSGNFMSCYFISCYFMPCSWSVNVMSCNFMSVIFSAPVGNIILVFTTPQRHIFAR